LTYVSTMVGKIFWICGWFLSFKNGIKIDNHESYLRCLFCLNDAGTLKSSAILIYWNTEQSIFTDVGRHDAAMVNTKLKVQRGRYLEISRGQSSNLI
jgi:hypothetical protein